MDLPVLLQYLPDGEIINFSLNTVSLQDISSWKQHEKTRKTRRFQSPATGLYIDVTPVGYGIHYSVFQGGTRISENWCCLNDTDAANMLMIVKIRMEKYKMTAAEPHTFYWIYTTLFRPHYLNQKEREELLAITPILYMMFRKEHPFNSICDFE